MPRKQTSLRGPKPNISTTTQKQSQSQKRKHGRKGRSVGLDALSIAESQYPSKLGVRKNRLGDDIDNHSRQHRAPIHDDEEEEEEDDDGPRPDKRRRTEDGYGSNEGSDGEGHQFKLGVVDSENDSEVDSDEAMASSDEDDFEGFTFRGSSKSNKKDKGQGRAQRNGTNKRQVNLSEDVDDEGEDEDEDDLGEEAVDLATAWDMNMEEDEGKAAASDKSRKSNDNAESESEDSDDSGSGLSLSDDDEAASNEQGLSKLQNFVNSMEADSNKPRQETNQTQEQGKPSEYGLHSTRKLTITDLLPSITDPRLKSSLKHIESTPTQQKPNQSGIPGKLDAPLPQRQQEKLGRAAAYEKSKETLDRWLDTVKANRRAEHLSFPLPDPDAQQSHKMEVAKPRTDLEGTIQDILVESGLVQPGGKPAEDQVQEYEELQTRKLPIEEVRARRAELRKHRDLLFREEVRSKRIKKIKSKSYRRVHRRERERKEQQERQALMEAGVNLEEDEREMNERRRAEARMGSKHRDSKWAKSMKQTGRTAWDEEMRHSAVDLAQREEELRRRIEGKRVSGEGDDYLSASSSSESEEEEDPWREDASDVERNKLNEKLKALETNGEGDGKQPYSRLLSMKFMQNADANRREQNDAEIRQLKRELNGDENDSNAEAEQEVGRRKFGITESNKIKGGSGSKSTRNEFEEPLTSDDEDQHNHNEPEADSVPDRKQKSNVPSGKAKGISGSGSIQRPTPSSKTNKEDSREDSDEENPWLTQTSKTRANRRRTANDQGQNVDIELPETTSTTGQITKNKPQQQHHHHHHIIEDNNSDEDTPAPILVKNQDLVKKAFAGDEVVQEFEEEKNATIEEEGDQVIDNTLPGWGSWTGEGISKKQRQQQKKNQKRFTSTIEGVKPEKRRDAKLSRVIINEKRVPKVSFLDSWMCLMCFMLMLI